MGLGHARMTFEEFFDFTSDYFHSHRITIETGDAVGALVSVDIYRIHNDNTISFLISLKFSYTASFEEVKKEILEWIGG